MSLLPIEIYLSLVLLLPIGVCFAKWNRPLKWWSATWLCAAMSWGYLNLWMMVLDPPKNGFAAFVYFFTGWFWLLPVFGVVAAIFKVIESRFPGAPVSKGSVFGYRACVGLVVAVVVWNFVGGISRERAVAEARHQLTGLGYFPEGREVAEYQGGGWTIRYPDSDFGEIRLTRNGRIRWVGAP